MQSTQPPPQNVLNEMRQQLELATTKCGSLLQQLDIVKDRMRKSSSTSLLDLVEDEENSQNDKCEENDEKDNFDDQASISDVYQDLSSDLNQEIKDILGSETHETPRSASSESSHKSIKSRQDIIDIFIKRLENNDDENSGYISPLVVDNDNYDDVIEDEDIGHYLSSITPIEEKKDEDITHYLPSITTIEEIEEIEEIEDKQEEIKVIDKIERKKSKMKIKKPKIPTKLPSKLSPYQTSSKLPKKTNIKQKKNDKKLKDKRNIIPVNDVVHFMKKVMNRKDNRIPPKTIRSTKKKDDFIQNIPFINPNIIKKQVKRSKSTLSTPLVRQTLKNEQRTNKIANLISQNNRKNAENVKKIQEKHQKNIEVQKEEKEIKEVTNDVQEKLVSTLVEKLKNIKKQQEQRCLVSMEKDESVPKPPSQTRPPSNYNQKNDVKKPEPNLSRMEILAQPKTEKIQKPFNQRENFISNACKNIKNEKIEPKKIQTDIVKKIGIFETKNIKPKVNENIQKTVPKTVPKSETPKIETPKIVQKVKKVEFDTQSLHPRTAVSSYPLRTATQSNINLIQENIEESFHAPKPRIKKPFHPALFNSIPFIVGQSTSKSYHIGLNIQQTLSLFKLTPSTTSLNENPTEKAVSEKSSAFTLFVTPNMLHDKFKHKPCPACVNSPESDDEEGDPWAIPQRDNFDQTSRQFSTCTCLPRKLVSFHEVLSQLFQTDNKLLTKYQNNFVNSLPIQNEEDVEKIKEMVSESQKSSVPYRQNNTFYYTKLLRNIQKLQDTFVK